MNFYKKNGFILIYKNDFDCYWVRGEYTVKL